MLIHQYRHETRVATPGVFDLPATVFSHGWIKLEPWSWDGQNLSRPDRIGEARGVLMLSQMEARAVRLEWAGDTAIPEKRLAERAARWLSWGWDATEFRDIARSIDPRLAAYVESGGGRFLRGSGFFEDFVKTVCTINTTWDQTRRMVSGLVGIGGGFFPMPGEVIAAGPSVLKEQCRLGFRVETVLRATERMLREGIITECGDADEDALTHKYLLSLWGIGPYAAAHCRMLLHDFSRLPIDSEVSAFLAGKGVPPETFKIHFSQWGRYAFLGYKLGRIIEKTNWIGGDSATD